MNGQLIHVPLFLLVILSYSIKFCTEVISFVFNFYIINRFG